MERVFEVVTDAFGNVISITEVDNLGGCLFSLIFMILGIILWAIGSLIFIFFMFIINGFRALFRGEIGKALLYFSIPAALVGFVWYTGLPERVYAGYKSTSINSSESIKGYFIYPGEHYNTGPMTSRDCFEPEYYNRAFVYSVPEQFKGSIIQNMYCGKFVPSASYVKFDEQGYHNYIGWIIKNGVDGLQLVSSSNTNEGKMLIFEKPPPDCSKSIIMTVDEHKLLLRLDVRKGEYGVNACEVSFAQVRSGIPVFFEHK